MHKDPDGIAVGMSGRGRPDFWDRVLSVSIVAVLALLIYLSASGRAVQMLVADVKGCAGCVPLASAPAPQWRDLVCPRDPDSPGALGFLADALVAALPTASAAVSGRLPSSDEVLMSPLWPRAGIESVPAGRAPASLMEDIPYAVHPYLNLIVRVSIAWATLGTLLLAFRTALWFRYRPYRMADMDNAPALTVIIPAYNEGAMVEKTIDSVAAARYPRQRLEILAVDDGSKDDTWDYIERAARAHPDLVTAIRFPANRGKRAALEAGFRRARGEVVVTIDSDSVIEEDTLLAMAGPFADPRVGAVAGQVAVYNRHQGLIPRMLSVQFVLAFDFLRAAQSVYRTVYCCPGALAAYRTSVVREVLDAWVNQKFLGTQCTYGEDRSMTNYILAHGYDSLYQRSGVVHTIVPRTYRRLCKMYLRWDRSYVREELRLCAIAWRRPLIPRVITLIDVAVTVLRYPAGYLVLALIALLSLQEPAIMAHFLYAIALVSALNMCYYLRSRRSWHAVYELVYSYFSVFALFWVFPYAVMTVRSRAWLTR